MFTDFLKAHGVSRRNPYVDVVARHAGTLGDTGDLIGAFARGDVGKLPAVAKGVIVDGLLGTLVGVPTELVSQGFLDTATTSKLGADRLSGGSAALNAYDRGGGLAGAREAMTPEERYGTNFTGQAMGLALDPTYLLGGGKKKVVEKGAKEVGKVAPEVLKAALAEGKAAKPVAQKVAAALPEADTDTLVHAAMDEVLTPPAKEVPDLSIGNLNERLNASPVALPGERVASAPSRMNELLNAAYGDKRRHAAPDLLKRIGAKMEGDGRVVRNGRDITPQVISYLEDRPNLKGAKALEARRAQLLDEVQGLPNFGGGDIAAGGGGMGIVPPAMLASMRHPEVLTTAIGATGGALAGGAADPDGGADGYIGGALAGGAAGYGAGKIPAKAVGDMLGIMHGEGKRAFSEAAKNGTFKFSSLAADWKADKVETVRGLGLDALSGRVRAMINHVPQAAINGSERSLIDRWKAAGAFVPYSEETEEMLRLGGLDPAAYDWARTLGQGYMAGAGEKAGARLHPAASAAAGAAYSLAGPGAAVPMFAIPLGAARGAARPYTSGAYRAANDLEQYAIRDAAFKQEARGLLERAHAAFAESLRALGVDPSPLRADGLYSAKDVEAVAPGAGQAWQAVLDQIYGVPAVKAKAGKAAATAVEQTNGLAGKFVHAAFGDYGNPGTATKWLDRIAPFSRYAVGQAKPMAKLARENPVATMMLAKWLAKDKASADREGRPGYQVGTVRVDTETPVIGRLVRAQLGGGTGEGRINPLASVSPVGGSNLDTGKFEDADTPYKWAEAVLGVMGFQFNPLIASAAYVAGGDYGTDRAPGAQSRTSGIEAALPGGEVPGLKGLLDQGRKAMGNYPDDYDPIDLLAKEIIFEQEQKPASDPSLRHRREELLDPDSPLMREARRRYEGGGAARNAVSLVSPVTMQVNTDEKVAYRQARAEQEAAGQEKASGAATMYTDPKYAPGSVKNGKKVDPRLREFERTYSTMKRLAPNAYAQKRKAFIKENGITE